MSDTTHSCRLYLAIPHDADARTLDAFQTALDAGDVACALLHSGPDGAADRTLAARLCEETLNRDALLLIENDLMAAESAGADGVHIMGDETLYEAARAALGPDAIIGSACRPERHAALTLAEKGADYIAFGGDGMENAQRDEMIAWWAEIVEVPVVAWGADDTGEAAAMARLGADFVMVDETVWNRDGDAAEAVGALNRALGRRRSAT